MMTMKQTIRTIMLCLATALVAGCASKTDLYMLQDDVKELKQQTQRTGGESAEVYSEVEKLREEIARLQGTIEELRNEMAASEKSSQTAGEQAAGPVEGQADQVLEKVTLPEEKEAVPADTTMSDTTAVAAPLAAVMEPEAKPAPPPSSEGPVDEEGLYSAGKKYFENYNYPAARKELALLLENYPSSEYADDAQYYIAETYYNEKWYEKAILEYQLVIEKYPKGDKRPAAYFKQGLAFENIGDSTNAKVRYKELIQLYPGSNEAKIVGRKLQ